MDNKWIPVEEGLPEESGDYLASVREILYKSETRTYYLSSTVYTYVLWWDSIDRKWEDEEGNRMSIGQVIAWMPLVEPFKYEGEELEEVEYVLEENT